MEEGKWRVIKELIVFKGMFLSRYWEKHDFFALTTCPYMYKIGQIWAKQGTRGYFNAKFGV